MSKCASYISSAVKPVRFCIKVHLMYNKLLLKNRQKFLLTVSFELLSIILWLFGTL